MKPTGSGRRTTMQCINTYSNDNMMVCRGVAVLLMI